MKNYPLELDKLHDFSHSMPYGGIPLELTHLHNKLELLREKYHFPAITNDIGCFIKFIVELKEPQVVFEMGSGYGHSAFWFLQASQALQKIYLTEKREDVSEEFKNLPWPQEWKEKIHYHLGDAFDLLENISDIDMALIDGVKADYLSFLKSLEAKMIPGSIVFIDNSFWRGSFLDSEMVKRKISAQKIKELHGYIANTPHWRSLFIPYTDGLSVLVKT